MAANKVQNKIDACGILCVFFVYLALIYSNYAFLIYVLFYVDYKWVTRFRIWTPDSLSESETQTETLGDL